MRKTKTSCRSPLVIPVLLSLLVMSAPCLQVRAAGEKKILRAGAFAIDITPQKFPVIVNAMFTERTATNAHDPLHARCLVLDDGSSPIAITVVDSCMLPRDLIDRAKEMAHQATGIRVDRMLVSATHTHSAPSAMGCLGSRPDPDYVKFLPGRIAEAIERAYQNLTRAKIGWTVAKDFEHTHNRRWIRWPDRVEVDPFGKRTVRANMHPGYQSPDVVGPSGPVDPEVSILSVQSLEGRPIALLANYSMHYYDSPLLSADYYGLFADKIGKLIGATAGDPPFVGIMSQGTSGDQMWMDYGQPRKDIGLDAYAAAIAAVAYEAYKTIHHRDWAPVVMREAKLTLRFRVPDETRLAWAKGIFTNLNGRLPRALPEVYAQEQIFLHQRPKAELKLQAIRIGELGIAAIPNEVFAISGLKIKAQSPLQPTFNIELANGAEGYIPPPEQHKLGGYTTWPARTAGLEEQAEPKIVETVLNLLEKVSGKPRRKPIDLADSYARAVLRSKPLAYWRCSEFNGPLAQDATGARHRASYEDGVAFYLPGPEAFSGGQIHRAVHFAGGRMKASLENLGHSFSIEAWFWNGLPNDARAVTGYLFSRGDDGDPDAAGDHLGIGGTNTASGRLLFFNGNKLNQVFSGQRVIQPKTWNHLVLVRDGKKIAVFLNGTVELEGEAEVGYLLSQKQLFIGGRNDHRYNFEGKMDEVSVYNRVLTPAEIAQHYQASGVTPPRNQ